MRITVTARHCDIPESLKERTKEVVTKVAKIGHRPQHAEVVFDADHGRKVVEVQIAFPRGHVAIATAEADDFHTALDAATDKLRNQLDKSGRRTTRRTPVL